MTLRSSTGAAPDSSVTKQLTVQKGQVSDSTPSPPFMSVTISLFPIFVFRGRTYDGLGKYLDRN